MVKREASLSDKYDLSEPRQLLSGTQAIVRLVLAQKARDVAAGLNTAGYVTGYRGSPIATIESAFARAAAAVKSNSILFQPAINEDLAATAIWGSQQAELRGEGKYDGVFAIWYGKGPGVDRSGDAFRHANHAGTSKYGGVLALMGDDHTCESSTSAHQSEFALVDAMMPIFNPAGVQEILDYGLYGFALSRFAGVWVGIKCVKDNMESTATVDDRIDRVAVALPGPDAFAMPPDGLNIRLNDTPLAKEARLHDFKRAAILAFVRANALDRLVMSGGPKAKIGIITAGKSYLDTRQALGDLGIDEKLADELGLRLYKVAMTWPIEPQGLAKFADGLDAILVIEEKRSLIETQVKERLFDAAVRPRVLGKQDETGASLFPAKAALEPLDIALAIGERLLRINKDEKLTARLAALQQFAAAPVSSAAMERPPYFCPGCPHNTSTTVPEGSRAYAGIGCHYLAQWMDRATEGFTQMGAEGANWIGEAPFSRRRHVFQNIGDGTYIHSGSLAIRAAIAAGTNITYKLLYNDAVAMTGGQPLEGGLTVAQIASQMLAEGAAEVIVVSDEPGKYGIGALPDGVAAYDRRELDRVQRKLTAKDGVTVLIYDQTCAAEKRRRRRRGVLSEPSERVVINPAVCEGCGDCGEKSNCVAILPLETELGMKRTIDQSACNKDFSCLNGFCPSFVTVSNAPLKARVTAEAGAELERRSNGLAEPKLPSLDAPYAILATGVGGTGVVTVTAVLGQAAHLAGLAFGAIDMTGIAQKGGAVACHMRLAARAGDIHAIRVGTAGADLVLGGDLVVTAAPKILEAIRSGHTAVVYSSYEMPIGDFTRNPDLAVPGDALRDAIATQAGSKKPHVLNAHQLSLSLFADTIFANMVLVGFAFERGLIPIPSWAIESAIRLNAVATQRNLEAFRAGRLAAADPSWLEAAMGTEAAKRAPKTLEEIVAVRVQELVGYQDARLAERYRSRIGEIASLEHEKAKGKTGLAEAAAAAYFKLLAYKDEYEVARLFSDGRFEQMLAAMFDRPRAITFHLAPPVLARKDRNTGEPRKVRFGRWMLPVFRMLAKGKHLRGTWADAFGYQAERRLEKKMIKDYERLLDEIAARLSPATHAVCVRLAELPLTVRGFGHVKKASWESAKRREAELLGELRHEPPEPRLKAAE